MVKQLTKIIFFIFLVSVIFTGCNVDFLGFFASNDLDERLAAKDNFNYIVDESKSRDWRTLFLNNENDYSFIVLTDTHIEDGNAFELEKIAKIIKDNVQIEFAVILGDITQYGTTQDIKKFMEIAELFDIPCYPVIGNHDVYFKNWPNWNKLIGSTNYKITGPGINLYILDSANSFFGKQQLNWLESEVKNATGKVFVFTHCPLFVTGPADMQELTDIRERARIVSILRNRCDIMFMGHSHKRYINEAGNVQYVAIEDFKGTKAYCLVTVTNSKVTYKFKSL
jgi:predicted phosphodiesterase